MAPSASGIVHSGLMMVQILSVLLLALTIIYVRRDYQDFISLGPGGTPQTWTGYLRIKLLGLFRLRLPYAAIPISADMPLKHGHLRQLPQRKHARPRTKGIAPHRQIEQRAEKDVFKKLAGEIEGMAPGKNHDLVIGTSCFEKHGTGLFTTCTANETCRGEIVHAHPSDGSMHMTLHPADANMVLRMGWGERHPLAGVFFNCFLPMGFMMVYAPQTEEEIKTVVHIIQAACWYVSQGDAAKAAEAQTQPGVSHSASAMDNYLNQRQIEDPRRALAKI